MQRGTMVIAVFPVNVDELARSLGMTSTLEPGDGYERTSCDLCGVACWIGPRQRQAYETTRGPVAIACYMCITKSGGAVAMINLGNPNSAREKPL